ncbi:hypothetical protein ACFE04_007227 [Oxalis oulophora]
MMVDYRGQYCGKYGKAHTPNHRPPPGSGSGQRLHLPDHIVEINPHRSCQQQIQRQKQLTHCQEYMREEAGGSSRHQEMNQEADNLRMCCKELKELDTECVCEGLKIAAEKQESQQGQGQGSRGAEAADLYKLARRIPVKCGVLATKCDIGTSYLY